MTMSGPQIISELRERLPFEVGRHLYAVLGAYAGLERFETQDLAHAADHEGRPFPKAVNVNQSMLQLLPDEDLRRLVRNEASFPNAAQTRLNQALEQVIRDMLAASSFLILKQVELIFAYNLDLGIFRTMATNKNHVLLLLPGERRSDQITLFHEADPRFHRALTPGLFADNHIWELRDG